MNISPIVTKQMKWYVTNDVNPAEFAVTNGISNDSKFQTTMKWYTHAGKIPWIFFSRRNEVKEVKKKKGTKKCTNGWILSIFSEENWHPMSYSKRTENISQVENLVTKKIPHLNFLFMRISRTFQLQIIHQGICGNW